MSDFYGAPVVKLTGYTSGPYIAPAWTKDPLSAGSGMPAPNYMQSLAFSDMGSTGLRQFGGYVREEFSPQLVGRQAAVAYREMQDNSSVVGALMYAIRATMRKVDWRVDGVDDSGAAKEKEDFADSLRQDMSHTWEDLVDENLSMLGYGYCLPGNQNVTLENGRPIRADTVKVGDRLMTKEGRGRPVLQIFKRHHDGILTRVRMRGYPFPIRMTPNHQIVTNAGWKNAGDLEVGEMLLRPRPVLAPGGDYASGWIVGLYAAEGSREKGKRTRITFSLHLKEVDEVAAILTKWIEANDLKRTHHLSKMVPQIMRSPGGGLDGRVMFSHPALKALIDEWVGGDSSGSKHFKKMPADEEFARGVIDGWMYGDGHKGHDARCGAATAAGATISESMAFQLQIIAGGIGMPSPLFYSIGMLRPCISGKVRSACYVLSTLPVSEVRHKRTVAAEAEVRHLRAGGMAMQAIATEVGLSYLTVWRWLNSTGPKTQGLQCDVYQHAIGHEITEVATEAYCGEVYDFEIEEDHTYCAGPFAIHNSPHEIVYKRRLGREPGKDATGRPLPASEYDDGLIGWRRIPIRGQDTVLKWFFGDNGEILGMTQQPWIGGLVDLPIEKMLLFRPSAHKGNPEGRSVLRTAWRAYYFVKRLEEQEAILFERLSGLPVMKIPATLFEMARNGDANATAAIDQFKKIIKNVRIDEQMGLLIPSDMWPGPNGPSTEPQYKFELATPQSARLSVDADKAVTRYNVNIMTSVLADFLQLGHESRGTQSLAVTKVDMFFQAIEGFLNSIAGVYNRYALPRVWDLNAFDFDLMPKFTPDLAQRLDLDVLSNFVLRLGQSGMPLFPDLDLENMLRDAAGLPDVTEDSAARALGLTTEPVTGLDAAATAAAGGEPGTGAPPKGAAAEAAAQKRLFLHRVVKGSLARRFKKFEGHTTIRSDVPKTRRPRGIIRRVA